MKFPLNVLKIRSNPSELEPGTFFWLVSGHQRRPLLALRVAAADRDGDLYAHVLLSGENSFVASVLRRPDIGYGLALPIGELEVEIPFDDQTSGDAYQPGALVVANDRAYVCAHLAGQVVGPESVFISMDDWTLHRIDAPVARSVFTRWRLLSHRGVCGERTTEVLASIGQW